MLGMRTCFPCHIPDRWSRGANCIWPDLAFGFVHKRSGNEIREKWRVLSMRLQVSLDSLFARPSSAPILGGKKGDFRDWTNHKIYHFKTDRQACRKRQPVVSEATSIPGFEVWECPIRPPREETSRGVNVYFIGVFPL